MYVYKFCVGLIVFLFRRDALLAVCVNCAISSWYNQRGASALQRYGQFIMNLNLHINLLILLFQNPLEVDLVINLPQDGVRLIFDPVVQRLKVIEIYNMKLVKLKYW